MNVSFSPQASAAKAEEFKANKNIRSDAILNFPVATAVQPLPLSAKVSYSDTIHGVDSHIGRTWDLATCHLCQLCPVCTVDAVGHCQIKVNSYVHEDDAAEFSVVAFLDGC